MNTPQHPASQWLSPLNQNSPFDKSMREHLTAKGKQDPRVFDIITRLEAKGEEGLREEQFAKEIGGVNADVFLQKLHQHFRPEDEDDILRLAAYISDHSYAHFFTQYAVHVGTGEKGEEQALYNEALQRIAPIVAELQPAVAIGYAPQIFEVYSHLGTPEVAVAIFDDVARQQPYKLLSQRDRFADMPQVLKTAEEAIKTIAPRNEVEVGLANVIATHAQIDAMKAETALPSF